MGDMRPSRTLPPVLLGLWMLCGCTGGPPQGECNGTWGGLSLAQSAIDPWSKYVTIYPATCAESAAKSYAVSWGNNAVNLVFLYRGSGPSILGDTVLTVPPPTTLVEGFQLTPTGADAKGTITLNISGLLGRRTGTVSLTRGTDQLSCTFDLGLETAGDRPRCGGGSSGGGVDFD